MGSKVIIEAKNFRSEAERESVDLNPTPAADQKMSELVKENHQAQDEKENALYIPRSPLTGRRHVGEFYFSIEPGCTIWPASHPVMMPTTNCHDGFLALATVRRSSPGPRFSVTMTVPFALPGIPQLTAFVTSSFTMSRSELPRLSAGARTRCRS